MGSTVHAKSLADTNIKVKAMIALDMIGYFTDKPNSQEYPLPMLKLLYPNKGNYIEIVSTLDSAMIVHKIKNYMKEASEIDVHSLTSPLIIPGIDLSDHQSYWKYNYKAVMITDTSFYRNPNYHKKTDIIESLDFDRMKEVVKGIYWTIVNL